MPIPKGYGRLSPWKFMAGGLPAWSPRRCSTRWEGYVTILHEFVHGYQFETCEQATKNKLGIALQAQEKGDFMWESAPFPLPMGNFYSLLPGVSGSPFRGEAGDILAVRGALYSCLGRHDFEYMVWQEWKEGFARWVENRLRIGLGLQENFGGRNPPFSRVSFYAGGAALVDYLQGQNPILVRDLEALFYRISLPMIFN